MDSSPLKVNAGDKIKAKGYNDLVEVACNPQVSGGAGVNIENWTSGIRVSLTNQPTVKWTGKIVDTPSGGTDYTDARYYVKRQIIANSDTDPTTAVGWSDAPSPWDDVRTATNVAEVTALEHRLPLGTYVEITEEWDGASPSQLRYTFTMSPLIPLPTAIYQVLMSTDDLTPPSIGFRYMCFHS